MKKPLIGLLPQWDEEKGRLFNRLNYFEALEEAGALPVCLPLTTDPEELGELAERMDAFVFTGGVDVSPRRYGEAPLPELGRVHPRRDEMEALLLPLVMARGKSILGICRGIQSINVILGGTLYQDLPSQHPSEIAHFQPQPFDRASHAVTVLPGTPLASCLGAGEHWVNSIHHQAVKALAPALLPMALSPDGLVEAAWLPDYPYLRAYQWHPEYLHESDASSRALFRDFVESIRR